MPLRPWLEAVSRRQSLDATQARAAFEVLLSGSAPASQVGGFLLALETRGPSADELFGAASALRGRMIPVEHGLDTTLDTCGTGGDGAQSFNVSTTVAFVCAGAGIAVAKHGNRAVSSRAGSADVLEALGVPIDPEPERAARSLREVGLCFLFAPAHHPVLRALAPLRRELGVRTPLNLLGPLVNPACTTHQLVGIYAAGLVSDYATVLGRLGARRAIVVRGHDGLDEVSPCGPTELAVWSDGHVTRGETRPEDLGLDPVSLDALRGGDARDNAALIRAVLAGERGPRRDAVVLNAGWALYAAERADSPRDGVLRAAALIDDGRAREALERLLRWHGVAP